MKSRVLFLLFLIPSWQSAQQTIAYIQYTFNKAGMNPAASGTEPHRTFYYAFGAARQWVAFDNAPRQNFVNLSYTIRPPRSYRFWQNAGLYIDNEDTGLLGNTGAYAGYAIHFLVRKKLILSAGLYAGLRLFDRSGGGFDANDPVIQRSRSSVIVYPDIIPGVRVSNAKFFMDLAVRQLTVNRLQDFKGRSIGGPSKLLPTIFFSYGWKKTISDRMLMMPSFALHVPLIGIPVVDFSVMYYYANRVGFGAAIRNAGFLSGILQIRFLENVTAGLAYSYPLNPTRHAAPVSYEIMIGIVPFGMDVKPTGKHSVARCPSLSY
jgi:type IX secretion system PorP/SprF family membrane protein